MRVYFKSGRVVRVTREEGVLVIKAIDSATDGDIFYLRNNGKRYAMFRIAEIVAVK